MDKLTGELKVVPWPELTEKETEVVLPVVNCWLAGLADNEPRFSTSQENELLVFPPESVK